MVDGPNATYELETISSQADTEPTGEPLIYSNLLLEPLRADLEARY